MSYIKTNWKTGDVITADKLNNIENGIESSTNSPFLMTVNTETNKVNFSYNDFIGFVDNGRTLALREIDDIMVVIIPAIYANPGGQYMGMGILVSLSDGTVTTMTFSASSATEQMTMTPLS